MKNAEVKSIRRNSPNEMIQMVRGNLGILIDFAIMCIALIVITDSFATIRGIFNVVRQVSVNVFLVYSMTTVVLIGGVDLSVGSITAISGCLGAGFIANNGIPPVVVITLAIATDTAVEAVNGMIIPNAKIPPFIITSATVNIGRGFARIYTKATITLVDDDLFVWINSGKIFGNIPIQAVFMIIVVMITVIILSRTEFGGNIYAVGDNRQMTGYNGINAKRITFWVSTLLGLFTSRAGVLSAARTFSGRFSIGDSAKMGTISAVIPGGASMIGGVRRTSGTIIGCLAIDMLNNGMNLLSIDSSWQYVVKDLVVLLAVYIDYIKKEEGKG